MPEPAQSDTRGSWRTACIAIVVGAFVAVGAIYYFFNINQVPTEADTGTTIGQSTNER